MVVINDIIILMILHNDVLFTSKLQTTTYTAFRIILGTFTFFLKQLIFFAVIVKFDCRKIIIFE